VEVERRDRGVNKLGKKDQSALLRLNLKLEE
jgi:hypothetical protein